MTYYYQHIWGYEHYQNSDLIDFLFSKCLINPTYAIKGNGTFSVIDVVQWLGFVRVFIANKFALSIDMKPVIINNEEKNLA